MSSNNDSIWFMTAACSNTFSISPSLQGPISCSLENRRQFTNDFGEGNRRTQLCGAFVSQVSGNGSGQSICLFPAGPVPHAGRDASGSHTAGAKPNMTSSSNTISICSGATISRALKTDLDSTTTTFQWFATPIASITGASTTIETTDTLRNTLINTSASVMQIVTYTITPTSNPEGCVGNSQTIKVRVN